MTTILDDVHGGHHGGYERGMGHGVTRFYLKTSSTPTFTTPPDVLREMAELKSKMERLTQLVDHHTAPPPSAAPATPPTFVQPSSDAQGSTSAAQHSPQDISTPNPLASRLGGLFMGLTQEGYGEEDIRKAFVDFFRSSQQ